MNPNIKRRMEHNARMVRIMAEREAEAKALHEFQNSPEARERDRKTALFAMEAMAELIISFKPR